MSQSPPVLSALDARALALDSRQIWHPYAALPATLPNQPVVSASGVRLTLADGRQLIDGMSSWWAAIHGYAHPRLDQALQAQAERVSHVMFGGLTHAPAVGLAERLLAITPEALDRVFFSDSGSVSVEVALKLCLQYWRALGRPQKHRFMTVRGGYHGDTFGAMSVCDPVTGMHRLFQANLPEQLFAPRPEPAFAESLQASHVDALERLLAAHHQELAGFIIEPVVQGAGGMRFYAPAYLSQLRALCEKYEVLLIFDEVATGFGRTGKLFALEHAAVTPDVLCLGKALSGGYLSLAATLTTQRVSDVISSHEPYAFLHGPTFMANPLACAVACASIDLLLEGEWPRSVRQIEAQLRRELAACAQSAKVKQVRVLGAIGVVEFHEPLALERVTPLVVAQGVWLRPFGNLLYTMPPFIIDAMDLSRITLAMRAVVDAQ